jgi:hypothetical protein
MLVIFKQTFREYAGPFDIAKSLLHCAASSAAEDLGIFVAVVGLDLDAEQPVGGDTYRTGGLE